MSNLPFQCYRLQTGDIICQSGSVIDLRNGISIPVSNGGSEYQMESGLYESAYLFRSSPTASFIGGSGRNLIMDGYSPPSSGDSIPMGFWTPTRPGFYTSGAFTVEVTGSSAATISDGVDIVANQTTGTAPFGSFDSTTYGADTYNGGLSFTISGSAESTPEGDVPSVTIAVTNGTALSGAMSATSAVSWELDADSDWTLTVNADGSADYSDGTDIVATRESGSNWQADGQYASTSYGATEYNDGQTFYAWAQTDFRSPYEGFVYLKITESGGILSTAEGPFFGDVPTPGTGEFFPIIAVVTASGEIEQLHTGVLYWH